MRNTSKAAKFFIVCGIIFAIGLTSTILGAAFGGIEGFKQVAEKRNWIYDGPGDMVMNYAGQEDFHSVSVQGDLDVCFVAENYFKNEDWQDEHDLKDVLVGSMAADAETLPITESGKITPEPGSVLVIRGEKVEQPEINVNKGVLNIKASETTENGIHLNISTAPTTPVVYIFCKDDELKSIKSDTLAGDIELWGVTFDKADFDSASGDLLMNGITGKALTADLTSGDVEIKGELTDGTSIKAISGDVELSGSFTGETRIEASSGDVDFGTKLGSDKYDIKVDALSGDLNIKEGDQYEELDDVPVHFTRKGSPNKLNIEVSSGDVTLSFR